MREVGKQMFLAMLGVALFLAVMMGLLWLAGQRCGESYPADADDQTISWYVANCIEAQEP